MIQKLLLVPELICFSLNFHLLIPGVIVCVFIQLLMILTLQNSADPVNANVYAWGYCSCIQVFVSYSFVLTTAYVFWLSLLPNFMCKGIFSGIHVVWHFAASAKQCVWKWCSGTWSLFYLFAHPRWWSCTWSPSFRSICHWCICGSLWCGFSSCLLQAQVSLHQCSISEPNALFLWILLPWGFFLFACLVGCFCEVRIDYGINCL